MSMYPLAAVALDQDGAPWYPFRVSEESGATLYVQEPKLPSKTAQWAPVPPEYFDRPHIDLDAEHLGQLLYCTRHLGADEVDPNTVTAEQLADLLTSSLAACGCDPIRLVNRVYSEVGQAVDGGGFTQVIQLPACLAAGKRLAASW